MFVCHKHATVMHAHSSILHTYSNGLSSARPFIHVAHLLKQEMKEMLDQHVFVCIVCALEGDKPL